MTANWVCQLRQQYLQLFWKRHSMVQWPFVHFHWDNLYLKGWVFFLLEFIDPVLVTIRYCLFLFWCIHMTGWETMCTLLFSYNNRRGSPSWICLSSAIIREKQVQGLNLILWHWYLKKLHARYALLINFLYLGLCLYGDWFLYRIV